MTRSMISARETRPGTQPCSNISPTEFVDNGFDVRHLIGLICKSRTYQLSIRPTKWNEGDKVNYSHAMARRLPAELSLTPSIASSLAARRNFPRQAPVSAPLNRFDDDGCRQRLRSALGRPARQTACECERTSDLGLARSAAIPAV